MSIKIINPNPFGSLTDGRLQDFESKIQRRLVDDYRDFLLAYNGGRPEPSFFWITHADDGSNVWQFYGLHGGPHHLSIETYIGKNRYGVPKSVLPIADDGVGNFICLGISSTNYGEVFFLDHDVHPFDEPDSMLGITKIANSFSEFLLSLKEDPDG